MNKISTLFNELMDYLFDSKIAFLEILGASLLIPDSTIIKKA